MALHKTSRTDDILNFIVETVRIGAQIWSEIIEWEHQASQEPKNILKVRLEGILVAMLKDFRFFATVVMIASKIADIDEHSEIGLSFVRELIRFESPEYLSHRLIRRFLALKILKYNNSENYVPSIFGNNFSFIEVIIEMFNYKGNVHTFYFNILNNERDFQAFSRYIASLA
jgi:hypothetical protein